MLILIENVVHDETYINIEIFIKYFKHQNPSYLLKDLYNSSGTRNKKIVNHDNTAFIDLRNIVNRKKIPDKVRRKKYLKKMKILIN